MVKHIQTICRQQPTDCLSVFDYFVGLVLKGLILVALAWPKSSWNLTTTSTKLLNPTRIRGTTTETILWETYLL